MHLDPDMSDTRRRISPRTEKKWPTPRVLKKPSIRILNGTADSYTLSYHEVQPRVTQDQVVEDGGMHGVVPRSAQSAAGRTEMCRESAPGSSSAVDDQPVH